MLNGHPAQPLSRSRGAALRTGILRLSLSLSLALLVEAARGQDYYYEDHHAPQPSYGSPLHAHPSAPAYPIHGFAAAAAEPEEEDVKRPEEFRRARRNKVLIPLNGELPPTNFPPQNPFMSLGAWPTVHGSTYAQGSSGNCAVNEGDTITHDFLQNVQVLSNPITLFYNNDNTRIWGVSWTAVFRLVRDTKTLTRNSTVRREIDDIVQDVFHGAYSILDRNEVFYTAASNRLEAYYAMPPDEFGTEQITKFQNDFVFPALDENEVIRALVMSHDGFLVFATNYARVGVVTRLRHPIHRRSQAETDELPPNHPDYSGHSISDGMHMVAMIALGENLGLGGQLEVSNNIACDEEGGVYVVTDQFMHKIQWDGQQLYYVWDTVYALTQGVPSLESARLGSGSGSTPSLMGDAQNGRFVVLTDSERIMNVVIINADTGLLEDRHPVLFGLDNQEQTLSEQSVLVYGWRFVVVNNTPRDTFFSGIPNPISNPSSIVPGGAPPVFESIANAWPVIVGDAPYGVEQFEFNPFARQDAQGQVRGTIRSVWSNPNISIPNGIPTMSGPEQMMYGIGKRPSMPVGIRAGPYRGVWTLEGLDWWTGRSRMHYKLGVSALYNSVYAGTQIGPDCEIVTGTLGGIVRVRGFTRNAVRRTYF
eukprot:Selendium_serpulae@DN4162_c0_g1_i1.p1